MNQKGFTLIELIIYTVVFLIVIITFSSFVMDLIGYQTKAAVDKKNLEETQRAMEIILHEIKHAQLVYQATSVFDNHPGQLSLKTEKNPPSGELVTYVDFYLDDNNILCFKREGSLAESLTSSKNKIKNLVFNRFSTNNQEMIRVELTGVSTSLIRGSLYHSTTTLISAANLINY